MFRKQRPNGKLSYEEPGAFPRCPPRRALGHCQRETQPATSATASDEAEAVLSSSRACSSSIPLRTIRKSSETQLHGGEGMRTLALSSVKHCLSSTLTYFQFLQPLGCTSSLQIGHSFQKLLAKETPEKTFWTLSWGRNPKWPNRGWPDAARIQLHNHRHTSQEGREGQRKVVSRLS